MTCKEVIYFIYLLSGALAYILLVFLSFILVLFMFHPSSECYYRILSKVFPLCTAMILLHFLLKPWIQS